MTTWFTSDPHWGHANIIRYCSRPFADVDKMHHELRERWNACVAGGDEVWVLGDFVFGSVEWGAQILASLAGTKHLIMGNHDRHRPSKYIEMGFATARQAHKLWIGDMHLQLQHRPPPLDQNPPKLITLCGHVHERWVWSKQTRTLNVGVDVWGFTPVRSDVVVNRIRHELRSA